MCFEDWSLLEERIKDPNIGDFRKKIVCCASLRGEEILLVTMTV